MLVVAITEALRQHEASVATQLIEWRKTTIPNLRLTHRNRVDLAYIYLYSQKTVNAFCALPSGPQSLTIKNILSDFGLERSKVEGTECFNTVQVFGDAVPMENMKTVLSQLDTRMVYANPKLKTPPHAQYYCYSQRRLYLTFGEKEVHSVLRSLELTTNFVIAVHRNAAVFEKNFLERLYGAYSHIVKDIFIGHAMPEYRTDFEKYLFEIPGLPVKLFESSITGCNLCSALQQVACGIAVFKATSNKIQTRKLVAWESSVLRVLRIYRAEKDCGKLFTQLSCMYSLQDRLFYLQNSPKRQWKKWSKTWPLPQNNLCTVLWNKKKIQRISHIFSFNIHLIAS